MHLVDVSEGVAQLSQHGSAAAAIHVTDIIAFKRVHEALRHTVRLRTVHRRMHRLDAQFVGQVGDFGSSKPCCLTSTSSLLQKWGDYPMKCHSSAAKKNLL